MSRHPSLLRHLLAWVLGALGVVWVFFMAVGYRTGVHEAGELTDGHLASVASLLLSQESPGFRPSAPAPRPDPGTELKAHDYQQSLSVVVWDADGRVLARSGVAPPPVFAADEGFDTLALGEAGASWRVFARWDGPERRRKVMVMLSVAERDALARDIAEQVALPGLWLLPVVALVLALAIRRGLQPLHAFRESVNALDIQADTALVPPPHREFRAIAGAINDLIGRYGAALARERDLASEVAHELRTPLASLRLHAAALRQDLPPAEHDDAVRRVGRDAERASAVLDHLLALARADRAAWTEAEEELDLAELARRVAADFASDAAESGHELSVDAPPQCLVRGHRVLLELALRNLVENALTHTARGAAVQVRVSGEPTFVEVRDDGGPGTPRPRSASTRHLGLGLGHQVARKVAAVHHGTFERLEPGTGRSFRLTLPSRCG